jgi:hypothetical protein
LAGVVFCVALCALLLGQSVHAAFPFQPQGDEPTPSMGVFRIMVDPLFRPLLGPTGPPTSFSGYPGFHSSDGRLTSPMLIDSATIIGVSNPHTRFYSFPQPLGAGSWDIINGYSDYPGIPFQWAAAPVGTAEALTEIKSFALATVGGATGQEGCTNPLVPVAPAGYVMVKAGTFAGVTPRSLGIVQENVTPVNSARSFFDIFVEVNLPQLGSTESSVAFPMGGAILTNDQALVVTNLDLTSMPPQVAYIHGGNTNGVGLRFKFSNPPYWAAGDLFGTLELAGHGTFTNDCTQEAALTAATLGTTNAPMPATPTPWLRINTLFPSPGSTYDALMADPSPPSTSDTLMFTIASQGTIYLRNFSLGNLLNPISPPATGAANYSSSSATAVCQFSVDNNNWFPGQASGVVAMTISNTVPGGDPDFFNTEVVTLNLSGSTLIGNFMLRESPTKASLGQHSIQPDPRGYRVSSFFDVFTELSTDAGVTWVAADRSLRVQASAPAAAPGTLFITKLVPGGVSLQWLGPFTLQSAPNVQGPYADMGAAGGPLLNTNNFFFGPNQMFFRLRQ